MGTEFSDPAWWPTPPPKPPRKISTAAVVFGTFVPIAVIVILVVAIAGQKKHATAAEGRSLAAFEACMRSEGASTPSERSNSRFLEQDAAACRAHLPHGMAVPSFVPPSGSDQAAQRAFSECMQAATANIRRSPTRGPFGGGSARRAFENAIAVCRSLVKTAPGSGSAPPPAQTTTSTAVA